MSSPKLEACVAILQVLNSKGHLRADEIASATNINQRLLAECLSLLAEQGTLEEKEKSTAVYTITEGGKNVLAFFKITCS